MSRILDRPLILRCDLEGRPAAFRWQGRWRGVEELLDEWVYRRPWWEEAGQEAPAERTFYRVRTRDGGVCELALAADGRAWLYREFD